MFDFFNKSNEVTRPTWLVGCAYLRAWKPLRGIRMSGVGSRKQESFQVRVEQLVSEISFFVQKESDRQELVTEIIRLVLGIQTGMGSTSLRRIAFRNNILDDFTFFKNQYLDVSHYLHRLLWKAMVRSVQQGENYTDNQLRLDIRACLEKKVPLDKQIAGQKTVPLDEVTLAHTAAILRADVAFCLRNLKDKDLTKIRELTINEELNIDSIDMANFTTGKIKPKDLQTYVKTKSYTLTFLSEYDPGFTPDDFDQDLLCESIRVANVYGRSKCKNLHRELLDEDKQPQKMTSIDIRLQKYMETALNNKVDNLKEYYTCDNRRRVSTTDSELYKEKNKIKKLLQKNPTYHANKEKVQELRKMIGIVKKNVEKRNGFKRDLAELEAKMCLDSGYKELKERMDKVDNDLRHSNGDYYSMVTPLVRHDEGEDRVIDVADETQGEQKDGEHLLYHSEKTFDERLWLDGICEDVPRNIALFVRIVIGDFSPEFETWSQEHGIDTSHFDAMVNGAKRYCNVTKSQLMDNQALIKALTDR